MSHKALDARARVAQRRVDDRVRQLSLLSGRPQLTESERTLLPKMRKAAHQAIQYQCRLNRRQAKLSGKAHIPKLMRSSFKMLTIFKQIRATGGQNAAQAFLVSRLATVSDTRVSPPPALKELRNG